MQKNTYFGGAKKTIVFGGNLFFDATVASKNKFPHSCLHLESPLELSIFSENRDSKMKRMNLDVSKFVCVNTPIGTEKYAKIELFPP